MANVIQKMTATHYEHELSFLSQHDIKFTVLEKLNGGMVFIEVELCTGALTRYGVAMHDAGYALATTNLNSIYKTKIA